MSAGLPSAYGIEYAGGRVTVVHAVRRRWKIEREIVADHVDPQNDTAWIAVAERIRADQISGRAMVAVLVPAADSFIRPLMAPFPSVKKAAAVMPSLLDVQLPFPLDQCVYRFANLHSPAGGNVRAVAVAVPHDRLRQTLDLFQSMKVDPEFVEQEGLVLWRHAAAWRAPDPGRSRVVLYLGRDRTVVVAGKNDAPVSSLGTRSVWQAGADSAAAEKLASRIRQHLAGAISGDTIASVEFVVAGSAAAAADELRARLEAGAGCWHVMPENGEGLAGTLAAGILEPDAWTENLRAGSMTHANVVRRERATAFRTGAIVAGSAALLALATAASSHYVEARHATLQAAVRDVAAEITGATYLPRGQELFLARQHVETSGDAHRVFREWIEPDAYPLFDELVRTAGELGVTYETLSVRSSSVLARGTCADWNDTEKLTRVLSDHGWTVETERKDAGDDERVHFIVRAQP